MNVTRKNALAGVAALSTFPLARGAASADFDVAIGGGGVAGTYAAYRDLIQALVMVDLDYLILAVPNCYRYRTGGRQISSKDYENTIAVAEALYGHSRMRLTFGCDWILSLRNVRSLHQSIHLARTVSALRASFRPV